MHFSYPLSRPYQLTIYSHFYVTEISPSLFKLVWKKRLLKRNNSSMTSTFVSHSLVSDGSTFNTNTLMGDDGKLFNILQNSNLSHLFVRDLHKKALEGFTERQMQHQRRQSEDDALPLEQWPLLWALDSQLLLNDQEAAVQKAASFLSAEGQEIICCVFYNHQCNCDLEVKPIQHFIHGFNCIQLTWKLKKHQLLYVSSGVFKHKHTSQLVCNFPEAILLFQ